MQALYPNVETKGIPKVLLWIIVMTYDNLNLPQALGHCNFNLIQGQSHFKPGWLESRNRPEKLNAQDYMAWLSQGKSFYLLDIGFWRDVSLTFQFKWKSLQLIY